MVWYAEDTNYMSSSNKIDSVRNCQIGFKFYQFLPKSVRVLEVV